MNFENRVIIMNPPFICLQYRRSNNLSRHFSYPARDDAGYGNKFNYKKTAGEISNRR